MRLKIIIFLGGCLLAHGVEAQQGYLTLNAKAIPVRTVLKLVGQCAHKKMTIHHKIQGKIELHLNHQSCQKVLTTVLAQQNLLWQEHGETWVIEPSLIDRTAEKTELMNLRYAKASELARVLKTALSEQGRFIVDSRTNTLLIQDTPALVHQVSQLVQRLDTPVRQVMIAVRLVNIDTSFERELGVRLGVIHINHALDPGLSPAAEDPLNKLNVDLPSIAQNTGRLGLAVFKLQSGTFVDLELSALEAEGRADIISNPELIAANQQPAMIQAGQEIPYQETTSSGATSVTFKKAVLSLKVTPQIIAGGKVLLYLQVNQDHPSETKILGVPAIDTRQINTQILMNNGQTVVLGGVYEETKTNNVERVPFLASIPGIGYLFRYRKVANTRRELMIFVTPNIVEEGI